MKRVIAITGYPGCGKSTISRELSLRDYRVLDNLFSGTVSLRKITRRRVLGPTPVFVVGFWSHLLRNITDIVVLEAPSEEHLRIYQERNYPLEKAVQNIEAIKKGTLEKELERIPLRDVKRFTRGNQKVSEITNQILEGLGLALWSSRE